MEKVYTLEEIKNIITPVSIAYGVKKVSLFGSYARGTATPKSDIDLIIVKGLIRGLDYIAFYQDLEKIFGKHVDVVTEGCFNNNDKYDELFIGEIRKDEVVIYEQE